MTNAQIIFAESQRLAEEGQIKYTGRTSETITTEDGRTVEGFDKGHMFMKTAAFFSRSQVERVGA